MRANYAIRISTVKKLVVIVCLLCTKELSFANPSDTQRKHDGHCPHRARTAHHVAPQPSARGHQWSRRNLPNKWSCL
ncbi:hypothetical protein V8C86DRAFT_2547880 [Haematococcus lacustris]